MGPNRIVWMAVIHNRAPRINRAVPARMADPRPGVNLLPSYHRAVAIRSAVVVGFPIRRNVVAMEWMPRERWDALVRGVDCPLCAEVASDEPANDHGFAVADLTVSRLRLAANQWTPGYAILICAIHAREPYELGANERAAFFDDLMRAGQAIDAVYRPIKMNFQMLGNAVPHLHCHLVPRYYGDPAPNRPLDPNLGTRRLDPDEADRSIAAIRAALATGSRSVSWTRFDRSTPEPRR